ncbi:hypothetical protein WS91_15660 [Burkholderia sp. MSMB1498]|nr:hypothetical protein WS91_15660 [Burkholderia sp. MSMB1498]
MTTRPRFAAAKPATAAGFAPASALRPTSDNAHGVAPRNAVPRGCARVDRADAAATSGRDQRIAMTSSVARDARRRRDSHRAACASALVRAPAATCMPRRSRRTHDAGNAGDTDDAGDAAARRAGAHVFPARRANRLAASSTRRGAARAIGIIESKTAGNAGDRQDNHSSSPR